MSPLSNFQGHGLCGSMPGPHLPLSTLHPCPREQQHLTRGQRGELFLSLFGLAPFHLAGFDRRTGDPHRKVADGCQFHIVRWYGVKSYVFHHRHAGTRVRRSCGNRALLPAPGPHGRAGAPLGQHPSLRRPGPASPWLQQTGPGARFQAREGRRTCSRIGSASNACWANWDGLHRPLIAAQASGSPIGTARDAVRDATPPRRRHVRMPATSR